jgi:N-acetylmuramoyl-L-alanine amidase
VPDVAASPSASAAAAADLSRTETSRTPAATATATPSGTGTPSATPTPTPTPSPALPLEGRVVALDPGHQSGPGSSAQVPNGRGGTKACNNSGTSTNAGYTEPEFNWDVVARVKALLEAQGATVLLTRETIDQLVCVDERGTFAQDHGAEIIVSIHGDGNENTSVKGFFAIVSDPPLNDAQGAPSQALARAVLDRLGEAGFTPNAAYPGGLSYRSDIAGVSLSERPAVMFELGEMRNPDEAALMSSEEGRAQYAEAVAAGIADYLLANPLEP